MQVVMVGPFGMTVKSTMRERALPMAKALTRRGHSVTLIVPPWDSPNEAGKTWQDGGVQIINTRLPQAKGPSFHFQLTATLVRATLDLKPNVIHLFKPKAYAGLSHLALAALRRIDRHQARLIVDEDDWEVAWNDMNNYSPLQKRFFAWQEPWGLRHADRITAASRVLQELIEDLSIPRYKVHYVPNGVRSNANPVAAVKAFSEATFQPEPGGWSASFGPVSAPGEGFGQGVRATYDLFGRPVILLYTRFFEFQLTSLMAVIARVNLFMPEVRWLVVGQGYFEEEKKLEAMARAQHLEGKLIFAGWVPQESLPNYFAVANVALHPYDETMLNQTKCSVKLLDLLSAGVAVVASRVGQNAEYIVHGKTGLLVPPQNLNALADALMLVLKNRQLQHRLGREAARYVNNVFSWNVLVEEVEAAYKE
jgi:glycosyltransferase involved in cell wall biosynthesis